MLLRTGRGFRVLGAVQVSIALAITAFLAHAPLSQAALRYPDGFLWGAALSAHQSEGVKGGGENSDWFAFEHSPSSPLYGSPTADIATDHWDRYTEDVELVSQLRLDSMRISVAWEKIEPRQGFYNREAIAHYRDVLTAMRAKGIRPLVALHHFASPQWFQERGGWLSPDSPRLFLSYAQYVVSNLNDLCDLWITFHEPAQYVLHSYIFGKAPPGINSQESAFEAAFQIARAHRMAAQAVHDIQGYSPGGHGPNNELRGVGITTNADVFDPENATRAHDQHAADLVSEMFNWSFISGITRGKLEFNADSEIPQLPSFRRALPLQDLPPWDVGPSIDWLGIDYFTRYFVRHDPEGPVGFVVSQAQHGALSDNGRTTYGTGLERVLRQATSRFTYPLVVTANGVADRDDRIRGEYLARHLEALDRAVFGSRQGPPLDVRGYFYWSLTDQFEWNAGYQDRFGLASVQPNLTRSLRASSQVLLEKAARSRR